MRSSDALGIAVLATAISGCFAPLDLTDRRCPCDQGWSCDTLRDRCVRAGQDAAPSDVGPHDAGRDTAVPTDAYRADAPGLDAGQDAFVAEDDAALPPDAFVAADAGLVLCPPGARLCDDFESAVASRTPPFDWNATSGPRSTARAHGGVASGLFEDTGVPGSVAQVGIDTDPASTRDVWARVWLYASSATTVLDAAILSLNEGAAPYGNISLLANGGGIAVYSSAGAGTYVGDSPLPRDRWVCVALHVVVATAGRIEVLVDTGADLAADADTELAAGVGAIGLGLTYVGEGQTVPIALAFDDVAITLDGTPLPCD